jgi:hypothetical protein
MSGKDCGDVDSAPFAEWESYTRQPFVEVGDDSFGLFVCNELYNVSFLPIKI